MKRLMQRLSNRGSRPLVAPALILLLAACPSPGQSQPSPASTQAPCPPPVSMPARYVSHGTTVLPDGQIPAATSTAYRAPGGHIVVTQSGLLGDFFDDSYDAELPMPDGNTGFLFDRGHESWGFMWTEQSACHQRTLAGEGFSHNEFVSLLAEVGLVNLDPPGLPVPSVSPTASP